MVLINVHANPKLHIILRYFAGDINLHTKEPGIWSVFNRLVPSSLCYCTQHSSCCKRESAQMKPFSRDAQ